MATTLPTSLRTPDISRFAVRAAQLEKAKPVISYWCNYYIAHQILEKGLHNADAEALTYTTELMDQLEQFKAQNAGNDTVTDDVAGKAYVEQFGLETFSRADNAVRANKASKQTADTFQAAGTFLDLMSIWGPVESDIASKAKFAKYHALRIIKAIKAGEDPNLSNPKQLPEPEENLPELNPNDADVQAIQAAAKIHQPSVVDIPDDADKTQAALARTSSLDQSLHPSRDPSTVRQQRQPSVVEIPDESLRNQHDLARQSLKDESLHPSRAPSIPRNGGEAVSPLAPQDAASFYGSNVQPDVSPIEQPPTERKPSIGGNYFPVVPPVQSTSLPLAPRGDYATPEVVSNSIPNAPPGPSLAQAPPTFTSPSQASMDASLFRPSLDPENRFVPAPGPGQQSPMPPNFTPQPQSQQTIPHIQSQQARQHLSSPPPSIQSPPTPQSYRQPPALPQQAPITQYPPSTQPYQQPPTHGYAEPQPVQPQLPIHSLPQSPPIPVHPPSSHYAHPPQPMQQSLYTSPPPAPIPISGAPANQNIDEEAMMKAQKHARWAISALNFEDVPTAIRELEGALKVLGAR